jgi:hypothetical protein
MRSRTNVDASPEASPTRAPSIRPIDSPRDRDVLVSGSLAKIVLVNVILSGSDIQE